MADTRAPMHWLLALALSSSPLTAADWPQFMGPRADLSASWPTDAFAWPKDGPSVAWRAAIGDGFGGVAIEGGEVFLLDREGESRDVLRVFGLADGKERWQIGYDAPGRLQFRGSRTVPTVTAEHVYTTGGLGHVSCFERASKALVWHVDLEEAFGGEQPMFGWSTHPVVVGDVLVAAPLSKSTTLVGLDRATGKEVWRTGFLGYSHSTPVLLELLGREQLVMNTCPKSASGQDQAAPAWVIALDPRTGQLLWKHELVLCRLPVPPPVRIDDSRIFVTGGYRSGSKLLRLEASDEGTRATEVFALERGAQIHAPVVCGEHLYFLANENWTETRRRRGEGGLVCLGLDGKEFWRTGAEPYFGRGGCVRVGDVLLVQDGFDGVLRAVRLSPRKYEELGSFRPFGEVERDGQMWAPPALSGTRLVIRSQSELVAVELAPVK